MPNETKTPIVRRSSFLRRAIATRIIHHDGDREGEGEQESAGEPRRDNNGNNNNGRQDRGDRGRDRNDRNNRNRRDRPGDRPQGGQGQGGERDRDRDRDRGGDRVRAGREVTGEWERDSADGETVGVGLVEALERALANRQGPARSHEQLAQILVEDGRVAENEGEKYSTFEVIA